MPERRTSQRSSQVVTAPSAARRAHILFTRGYVLALSLVAATVFGTGWMLNELVARQSSSAYLINIAGAQRMLSQRLALLAPTLLTVDPAVRTQAQLDFKVALERMSATHELLTTGVEAASRSTLELGKHYGGPSAGPEPGLALDARVRRFLTQAAGIHAAAHMSRGVTSAELEVFRAEAQGPMLAALDRAVTLHQAHADAEVAAALHFHRWTVAAALLLLAAEAYWIFRPLARRLAEQARKLEHDTHHDLLTGLLNRRAVSQRLALVCQGQRAIAVITIDLDWFKQTNDSEGQEGGDALLQAAAVRLRASVRADDIVGRMDGDEFSVFLLDCDEAATANDVAERIRQALHLPVAFAGRSLPLAATLGVALSPAGANDVQVVMRLADEALLQAKQHKRGSIGQGNCRDGERIQRACVIRESIDAMASANLTATDGLSVAFQPILRQVGTSTTAGVVGVEALARWTHPTLGVLSPSEFLVVAERSGRMRALGRELLVRGLRDYAWVRSQGMDPGRLSLNLSAAELATNGFVDDFEQQVAQAGLRLSDLSLEITEEVMLERISPQTVGQLLALHERGARLVVDDFGTGTSGLSQLLALPFDALKIDKVFIQALLTEPRAEAIVRATLSMARSLGLGVVAEGIETLEQATALGALGCDTVQGFLFAKPMRAAALVDWLCSNSPVPAQGST